VSVRRLLWCRKAHRLSSFAVGLRQRHHGRSLSDCWQWHFQQCVLPLAFSSDIPTANRQIVLLCLHLCTHPVLVQDLLNLFICSYVFCFLFYSFPFLKKHLKNYKIIAKIIPLSMKQEIWFALCDSRIRKNEVVVWFKK